MNLRHSFDSGRGGGGDRVDYHLDFLNRTQRPVEDCRRVRIVVSSYCLDLKRESEVMGLTAIDLVGIPSYGSPLICC